MISSSKFKRNKLTKIQKSKQGVKDKFNVKKYHFMRRDFLFNLITNIWF